jgi:uncharacterized protein YbaP (TraB family)
MAIAGDGPAMWQVEQGNSKVVLFGTVHLLPPNTPWQSDRLKAIVEDAASLTLEVEDAKAAAPVLQKFTFENGLYPSGQSLELAIGAEDFAKVQGVSQNLGLPENALNPMRPWLAALSLTLQYAQLEGFQVDAGAEAWLTQQFKSQNKPILGLEDPVKALGAVANHDDDVQKTMLMDTVEQLSDGGSVLGDMHDAWLVGDLEALDASLLQPMREQEALFQTLLLDRNAEWVPKVEMLLQTPGVHLVAVGTAHLIGEGSVIDLLNAQGYEVQRLP